MQPFNQMKPAGLDLPQSFCAMILLSHLPDEMFNLASTITQTVAVATFHMETVASRILAKMDLWATRRPLASWITAVQSEESSANRTNGVALHLKISGEVRLVLTRTNCHTNLTKTNLANKDLVLNRIKMVRKVRAL